MIHLSFLISSDELDELEAESSPRNFIVASVVTRAALLATRGSGPHNPHCRCRALTHLEIVSLPVPPARPPNNLFFLSLLPLASPSPSPSRFSLAVLSQSFQTFALAPDFVGKVYSRL